MVQGEKTIGQI